MIELRGCEVKTNIDEMTLKEYENFLFIVNDKSMTRKEMFLALLVVCGMKNNEKLMQVNASDVKIFIDALNGGMGGSIDSAMQRSLEINGREYVAFEGDDFELSFKDETEIEKSIINSKNENKWLVRAMAILFKDSKLTFKEHYTEAHIKHKESIFAGQNASLFVPYILAVQEKLMENITTEKDVEEVESVMRIIDEAKKIIDQ